MKNCDHDPDSWIRCYHYTPMDIFSTVIVEGDKTTNETLGPTYAYLNHAKPRRLQTKFPAHTSFCLRCIWTGWLEEFGESIIDT